MYKISLAGFCLAAFASLASLPAYTQTPQQIEKLKPELCHATNQAQSLHEVEQTMKRVYIDLYDKSKLRLSNFVTQIDIYKHAIHTYTPGMQRHFLEKLAAYTAKSPELDLDVGERKRVLALIDVIASTEAMRLLEATCDVRHTRRRNSLLG